ncbi:MAG: two-component sensor histidine kinase [Sulfurimonas sp.]|nr:MAG: two-component sensor histidine kinase [Sulfurimonas sp.]
MLKIHQIFVVKFLTLFIGTIIVSSVISYVSLKSIIIKHSKNHLQNAISVMSINLLDTKNLDILAKEVHDKTGLRVSIINNDGVVIAESNTDKKFMDNHGQRYEVIEANSREYSHIIRYSKTLEVDFLYVAKKFSYAGGDIYIRLSMRLDSVMEDFYTLWSKLIFVFLIILISVYFITKNMSKQVTFDINEITSYLSQISGKNYKAIVKTRYFNEFLHISLLLKNLVKNLDKRDKQKRKYTAKLRLMNKQRNDILSAISHEFKNPIASIIGYAQTIQNDSDMPESIQKKFLGKISSNGEKISKMLDRLALSVKLENGDLSIKNNEFDLKLLCNEVATNLRSKYQNREIIVEADECTIIADITMIELVLINLVDNALKYSSSEVKIIIKDNVVYVEDTGIGIRKEHINRVVSKFYRVDKNSWDNSMGIGLAMVSYILKSLNSSLEIESVFGKGSTFSFSVKEMINEQVEIDS